MLYLGWLKKNICVKSHQNVKNKKGTVYHNIPFLGGEKFVKFQEKNIENFSPYLDSDFSLAAFLKLFG
jgi:hypothetical protein